uniref:Junctional adhesion molecule 2b n=1 Tax=Oryzias sinensis TaxID=183150 RepID=A0A8C7X201_9TELE
MLCHFYFPSSSGSYAGRAQIEGATLTIHSVTLKDSGEYRCEVTASEDHVSLGEATVTLSVLVPPHVPSCDVPSSVFIGADLELLCKDKLSVPPATYSWYKDNKPLKATGDTPYSVDTKKGTLKLQSVSKADSGMYRCESSNSVGAPKSCVAQQLKVLDYPLNMTILVAGASGFVALVLICCICICVCRRRGCCKKSKKTKSNKPFNPPPPPPPPFRNVSDQGSVFWGLPDLGSGLKCRLKKLFRVCPFALFSSGTTNRLSPS